ncbi:hypothetical protein HY969_01235 [Candidatus Kaiserbacteria bacterium]|nr:hypothetical protein [Candidatus Kaiserbacteria bacterium]
MGSLFALILFWLAWSTVSSNTFSYFVPVPLNAALVFGSSAATISTPLLYTFNIDGSVPESSSMGSSWSPYWWVNSGGYLQIKNEVGQTVQGSLSLTDPWRLLYLSSNPVDTDNGVHPQNIFRLLTRSSWQDPRLQATFYITRDNFSSSPNRNASNGILFMSRYKDGNTLYYAGIRVDGTAVIKKKYNSTYYTMAQKKVFDGSYSEGGKNNLLPHNAWFHIRSDTVTNADGTVSVRLYLRKPNEQSLTKILEAKDSGNFGGTPPITQAGYTGIRTDFMDVRFDSFVAMEL